MTRAFFPGPSWAVSDKSERRQRLCRFYVFLLALAFLTVAAPARSPASDPLMFCVHPYLPASEIEKRFGPLVDYLGRELRVPVHLHIPKDYRQHIELIGKSRMDISFMGPASYVRLVEVYGGQHLLGRLETNGKPLFAGVIFVPLASPVKTLADLRGKRFAFGQPESTLSYLVPRYMLWKSGITIEMLSRYSFLSNHDNVVLGVLMGDFDAGTVMEDVFVCNRNRGIRVIARTPEMSEHVFVAAKTLPQELTGRIRTVLLGMKSSPEGRKVLKSIKSPVTGIVAARDRDYDDLRGILKELKTIGVDF